MNIDKSLYSAPVGLGALEEEPIEIEIVDPESVKIGIDGLEIEIEPEEETAEDFDANLAEYMDEGQMSTMASTLLNDIDNDKNSRKDWEQAYVDGLKLLGLKYEERTEPWNGACGVFHPMITEAVVRFQSETVMETFPAKGPVMAKIIGKETQDKKEAANRVQSDMNYQLTERMIEYRPEHEKMLWSLPATGSAFKKVYYDPSLGRQVSIYVPAEDIILPYGTSNIETCHRVTHEMRKTKNEIVKLQQSGFYRDVDIGEPGHGVDNIQKAKDEETGFADLNDERYVLLECHVDLNLPGFEDKSDDEETGIMLPYVVTLIKGTGAVLSIRRNWKEDDELRLKRQHFVHYQYIPGFGAYGFGLFHLIGGYAKSATSLMRQLVDSGTLANLPGGLKSRGLRIKGDDTPIAPGEWRDVDVGSGVIRDNILPLPYKEPSQTLFALLGNIVEEGRRFAATADMKVSDMSAQAPVGTTLALLERQLKVMTAIQARVHFSLKQEFKLLKEIIKDYADESYDYEPETNSPRARRADFSLVEVIPVSDPNAATMSQRVVQYQAVIQLAQSAPQIYDLPQLHRGMLDVLGIKHADKLVPLPEDQKPRDPVTENMEILKGKPVKAFAYQDHEAHIAVHTAAMQDPMLQKLIGQNPNAQVLFGSAQAHIAEHAAYLYRQKIEQQLGLTLPPEEEKLPPEIETALSGMMAQAAQRVLQQNQAMAQQQQAQQQMQDPVLQLQMQEMELKKAREARESKKTDADIAAKADELRLKEMKVQIDGAAKADQQELSERKQTASEEMAEQRNVIDAHKIGVMGRSMEAEILSQDRDAAMRLMDMIQRQNQTNNLGESK
jgi:hypothetical protein